MCRTSFVVPLAGGRPPPYQPMRDDPFPMEGGPRPIIMARGMDAETVNLGTRPVAIVLPHAAGQINRSPPLWAPEWVDATMVVYQVRHSGERPLFSVIFEDEGQVFRHIIDFFPFPDALPFDTESDPVRA